jgi:hypothetical protein
MEHECQWSWHEHLQREGRLMLSNDTGNYLPPSGGTYDYTTFKPGSGSFPGLLGTFTDPIFGAVDPTGSVITRLTVTNPTVTAGEDIYAHHWANCNGTSFFWNPTGGGGSMDVVSAVTGATLRSSVSQSTSQRGDESWHPTDPDKYFYLSGSNLREYTVSTGTSIAVHTFPSSIQAQGGSQDFVDATGNFFVIEYGGSGHVYRRDTDTIYTGATIGATITSGYVHMAANAKYAYYVQGGTFTAYPLDNVNNIVGTGFTFWKDQGDHAGFVSASDGNCYMLRNDSLLSSKIWRVKVKDQGSNTQAQMEADPDNHVAIQGGNIPVEDNHMSGVGYGPFKDWVFLSTEWPTDFYNYNPSSGWGAYTQELIAVNVLTLEVRRLCHHRSRDIATYDMSPKPSVSWDGTLLIFISNFNQQTAGAGYTDTYAIKNPLGTSSSATPIGGFKSL